VLLDLNNDPAPCNFTGSLDLQGGERFWLRRGTVFRVAWQARLSRQVFTHWRGRRPVGEKGLSIHYFSGGQMETIHNTKMTGLLRIAMVLICIFLIAVLTVGCDDDDSFEANLEEAKIAIDDGNFDKAVSILTAMAQTGEVLDVLASAYAGQVGIDTFEILAEVDDDDDDGNDGSIDLIGQVLGVGADNALTCMMVDTKLSILNQAITALLASAGNDLNALTEDGKATLAIYGFTDFILVLGDILCDNYGSTVVPPNTVILTEAWIKALETDYGVDFDTISLGAGQLASINQDIAYVGLGVTALDGDNDLAEEFVAFIVDIGGDDGSVTEAEFRAFLNGL